MFLHCFRLRKVRNSEGDSEKARTVIAEALVDFGVYCSDVVDKPRLVSLASVHTGKKINLYELQNTDLLEILNAAWKEASKGAQSTSGEPHMDEVERCDSEHRNDGFQKRDMMDVSAEECNFGGSKENAPSRTRNVAKEASGVAYHVESKARSCSCGLNEPFDVLKRWLKRHEDSIIGANFHGRRTKVADTTNSSVEHRKAIRF